MPYRRAIEMPLPPLPILPIPHPGESRVAFIARMMAQPEGRRPLVLRHGNESLEAAYGREWNRRAGQLRLEEGGRRHTRRKSRIHRRSKSHRKRSTRR